MIYGRLLILHAIFNSSADRIMYTMLEGLKKKVVTGSFTIISVRNGNKKLSKIKVSGSNSKHRIATLPMAAYIKRDSR